MTWGQRLCRLVFGSPSLSRAAGGFGTSLRPRALRTPKWSARRSEAPVFEVDRRGTEQGERLPRIWVTEPAFDRATGQRCGRSFVGAYPSDPDRGGWRALDLGSRYFAEGLGYGSASQGADARLRIDCFRAAELLFLHAARRGNLEACAKLGAIYAFDMAEGEYWQGLLEARAAHRAVASPERQAFLWLSRGALRGHGECCWRLGDLLAEGRGCPRDAGRAFTLYLRAFLRAADAEQAGFAALRLGRCFELAQGRRLSFVKAELWYGRAAESLEAAFDEGCWYAKRELVQARRGAARMAQELSGCY